jgi:hypothetical protein
MMRVDDQAPYSRVPQPVEHVRQRGPVPDRNERLRDKVRQRPEPRTKTSGEHHRGEHGQERSGKLIGAGGA